MSLKSSIFDEIQRSPIAAISGAIGVVVAALSLLLAWIQYRSGLASPGPATVKNDPSISDFSPGNVFILIAYFLAITIGVSLFLQAVARKHDITAFFVSIPLVALANFSTIFVVYLAPPRPISTQLFASAHDLIFYASTAIIVAFSGRSFILKMASGVEERKGDQTLKPEGAGSDGVGVVIIMVIFFLLWGWLVFAGQTRLTRTLLPEVAHSVEIKPEK